MRVIPIAVLTAALAFFAMPVLAQRQTPGPPFDDRQREEGDFAPDPGRGAPPPERREEIRKKIEAIRIWRLTEELKLDEKAAAKFFPVLSSLTQRRGELLRENGEAQRELRLYLESDRPDEKKIKASLDRLERNHHELMRLQEKEIEATKDYLTIEQQARYFLFQQDFQREIREMISGARGGVGPQGPRGQGQRLPGVQGNQRPGGPIEGGPGRDLPPRLRP